MSEALGCSDVGCWGMETDWDIGVSGQWDAEGWALSVDGEKHCR